MTGRIVKNAATATGTVTPATLGTVTDGVTTDQSGAGNTIEVKTGGISPTQLAAAAVTFAKLAASALPKEAAVVTSDFTTTSAAFVAVTGASITISGPALIIIAGQVVTQAAGTTQNIRVNPSIGSTTGFAFAAADDTAYADLTAFFVNFVPPGTNPVIGSFPANTTQDFFFVGWATAAATISLQAQSDGTRTITVKVGTFVASSI